MDATSRDSLHGQFGAALDMLENAIRACPDELWDATEGFQPPSPFTLSELEFSGVMPDQAYTKDELLVYLEHGRQKVRARVAGLTTENAREPCSYGWIDMTRVESLLYNMRHVQHHAAQLNLLLRQATNSAPDWVARAALDF